MEYLKQKIAELFYNGRNKKFYFCLRDGFSFEEIGEYEAEKFLKTDIYCFMNYFDYGWNDMIGSVFVLIWYRK